MRNKTILSIFANIMKVCVFCSANQQIDPEFFTMTEELGKWAAEHGHSIVYGGVNQGLMECVGKAAKKVWVRLPRSQVLEPLVSYQRR